MRSRTFQELLNDAAKAKAIEPKALTRDDYIQMIGRIERTPISQAQNLYIGDKALRELGEAMSAPIRRNLDYSSVVRRILINQELEEVVFDGADDFDE